MQNPAFLDAWDFLESIRLKEYAKATDTWKAFEGKITTWYLAHLYIVGYQPAQKWLKDRKCRPLSVDDLRHWQKITVALVNTDRLMQEIDGIISF